MREPSSVVVVGATGFVGQALVGALAAQGESVRAASRRPITGMPAGVSWVHCDVDEHATLAPALAGAETAYYLVHGMGQGRSDYAETDRRCAQRFASAAAASGCRRIIYLGGVAPRGRPSEHLASRLEVGEILRSGGVDTVELRASMIIGNGSASWRIIRDLAARLPFMVLPRWLDSKTCPIALPDVTFALLDARRMSIRASTWFDLPGPQILSAKAMLAIVAELNGRRIPSIRVPVLTPALSAMWLRLVSGADYPLARELVLGLTEDLLPQRSLWDVTGYRPRWTFREAAAQALATEAPRSSLARGLEQLVRHVGPRISARET